MPDIERFIKTLLDEEAHSTGIDVLQRIMNASVEELLRVPGFGEEMALSVYEYFHDPTNIQMIEDLLAAGVRPRG